MWSTSEILLDLILNFVPMSNMFALSSSVLKSVAFKLPLISSFAWGFLWLIPTLCGDSGETYNQTEVRNKLYTEAFLKKWGTNMTQILILRKDFSHILVEKRLNDMFKKGKFGELIRQLLK